MGWNIRFEHSDFTFKINLSYNDADVVMANTVV